MKKITLIKNLFFISLFAILIIGCAQPESNKHKKKHKAVETDKLKWEYKTKNSISSSAAIGSDGTIYVGSWDGKLYAINPDGSLKWKYTIGTYISSSAAIGADGTIYIGSYGNLYAINPDGSLKWISTIGIYISSSPAIGDDGTIYVGGNDTNLYAINPDGSLKWTCLITINNKIAFGFSPPAIGTDGTIYIGSLNYPDTPLPPWSADMKLSAVDPDGNLKWEFNNVCGVSSPAIGADGTIYVGGKDTNLYAINPDGSLKRTYTTQGYIYTSPAIGSDGTIYIESFNYINNIPPWNTSIQYIKLSALDPDGSLKWEFTNKINGTTLNTTEASSPVIGADGTIYVGGNINDDSNTKLYAINSDGSLKETYTTKGHIYSSPAIGEDGTIYIGGLESGTIYALYSTSLGLADSPWPRFHKNNQNTGKY